MDGRKSLLLVFVNFKNTEQMGEFEHGLGRLREAVKSEAGAVVAGDLEALDKRSDARTIHVFHVGHVDQQLRHALVSQEREQGLSDLRRIEKGDVPDQVENR